jgi:hypothetical protein
MFCAPVLQREVSSDPEEERAECPAGRIESAGISKKANERVLSDVFRSSRRARHAPGKPVDGILVLVESRLEFSVGHVAR